MNGSVTPYGPVNPNPFTTMVDTVTACGFKFCNENVHGDELLTVTLPQLKGTLLVQPAPLDKVGAVTPDPIRITDRAPAAEFTVRLALKLADEVGVSEIHMLNVCEAPECAGIKTGIGCKGYSNANPAPANVTDVTETCVAPPL